MMSITYIMYIKQIFEINNSSRIVTNALCETIVRIRGTMLM